MHRGRGTRHLELPARARTHTNPHHDTNPREQRAQRSLRVQPRELQAALRNLEIAGNQSDGTGVAQRSISGHPAAMTAFTRSAKVAAEIAPGEQLGQNPIPTRAAPNALTAALSPFEKSVAPLAYLHTARAHGRRGTKTRARTKPQPRARVHRDELVHRRRRKRTKVPEWRPRCNVNLRTHRSRPQNTHSHACSVTHAPTQPLLRQPHRHACTNTPTNKYINTRRICKT